MDADQENRCKLVAVGEKLVLDMFRGLHEHQFVTVPLGEHGIPVDAKVEAVHYDYRARCFMLRISHESFVPVPLGAELAVMNNGRFVEQTVLRKRPMLDTHEENLPFWIVGQVFDGDGSLWSFQGLFETEQAAVDACIGKNYFVGPAPLNYAVPDGPMPWPGMYYPHLRASGVDASTAEGSDL